MSEQIHPCDTLACCWDVRQPTKNNKFHFSCVQYIYKLYLQANITHTQVLTVLTLSMLTNLRVLRLTHNPIISLLEYGAASRASFPELHVLDLSSVQLPHFNTSVLLPFPSLTTLNLSSSGTRCVTGDSLPTPNLRVMDIRGSTVEDFPPELLQSLDELAQLHADSYKLCCPEVLPEGFNTRSCHAPGPVVSSCQRLLGPAWQRAVLVLLAVLTLLGNCTQLIASHTSATWPGRDLFLLEGSLASHLYLSLSGIGVYLVSVIIVDRVHGEVYLWDDVAWRSSVLCALCGVLFLVCNQAFISLLVCLTLERCLAITRGRDTTVRVRRWMCFMCWTGGILLASVPVLSQAWGGDSISASSLCVPLPVLAIHSHLQLSHHYGAAVLVVFNTLMVVAVAGQAYIRVQVHSSPTLAVLTHTAQARGLAAARRWTSVVVTCVSGWLLVAVVTVMTSRKMVSSDGVVLSVTVVAMLVTPVASPYLYLLSVIMERRRHTLTQRLL